MMIEVECRACGHTFTADVAQLIRTLINCAAHGSIYGGFECSACAEMNSLGDDDDGME